MRPEIRINAFDELMGKMLAEWICAQVGGPYRLLDVGAGDGDLLPILRAGFAEVQAIDPQPGNADIRIGDALTLEEPDWLASFDYITLINVLEHISNPVSALRNLQRYLKPEGKLIIVVPNATSLHRYAGIEMGLLSDLRQLTEQDHLVGHVAVYTEMDLYRITRAAGLWIDIDFLYCKPFSNSQMQLLMDAYTEDWMRWYQRSAVSLLGDRGAFICAQASL